MNYKKIDKQDIDFLKKICKSENVYLPNQLTLDYAHDELGSIERMPDVLVKIHTSQEVSKIMKYANELNIPVSVRGSGTGLVGSCVPIMGGIVLDTTLMNQFIELDEENLTLTVEPGVLLMDIYEYVEKHDLFYAPDPGEKSATIGGNISTNAGGMRAVKYGVTRDWVRGLEVVLPNGEIINVGGKVVKDSSGYAIKDLIIGSEGTLGIVTKAILKLLPLPKKSVSLLVPFKNIDDALDAVPQIIKSKVIPTAIEFMERDTIVFAEDYLGKSFPDKSQVAYVLLTFDGNSTFQIEEDYKVVANLLLDELKATDVLIVDTEERKESVWKARGAFLEAIKASTTFMDECDVVVPRNKIAEYIKFTHQLANELDLRIPSFGHAGDGNLHIYICKDDLDEKTWNKKLALAFNKMYQKANEFNGLVSGEHGIGFAKKTYMAKQYGDAHMEIMKNIKKAFDPNNILNPGKVVE